MPYTHEWSEAKAIPREVVKRVGEMGFLAGCSGAGTNPSVAHLLPYPLPAGIKPEEFDIFHEFICVDEIARAGSGGLIWALQGGLAIALPPVMNFAPEPIKNKVVPECLSGEKFIALAITEPSAVSCTDDIRWKDDDIVNEMYRARMLQV